MLDLVNFQPYMRFFTIGAIELQDRLRIGSLDPQALDCDHRAQVSVVRLHARPFQW